MSIAINSGSVQHDSSYSSGVVCELMKGNQIQVIIVVMKTKTKVTTSAIHSRRKQHSEPIIIKYNRRKARENDCFFVLLTNHRRECSKANTKQKRSNISNTRQCFIRHISNTDKRVENTTRGGVLLTNFEVFHIVMKHCDECLT